MSDVNIESEVKLWVAKILEKGNVSNVSIDLRGNSGGNGYMGDVIFVDVKGTAKDGSTKTYNLALKCSKRSTILREHVAIREIFSSEMYIYETVLAGFTQFQLEKGIENPFDSVAKCYGSLITEENEILALQNLKACGYELRNKNKTLTRKHINLVVKEYGKLHAISVAMMDQQPEKFQKLHEKIFDFMGYLFEVGDMNKLVDTSIENIYEVLKNDLDENILSKWRNFKNKINYIFDDLYYNFEGLKVITHGDCWNNNFMYYSDVGDIEEPSKVALLDWQCSKLSSPIFDLSYHLFTCISGENIKEIDDILKEYYQSFSSYLIKLGSDPKVLYPEENLFREWKNLCKYGIAMTAWVTRLNTLDLSEAPDIIQTVESGEVFTNAFIAKVKDTELLRRRMRCIVKYVVENDLI